MQALLAPMPPKPRSVDPPTEFARRFRALRGERTQGHFGRLLEIHQSTVSAIERGESTPTRQLIDKLVEVEGVDREEWEALAGLRRKLTDEERIEEVARRTAREVMEPWQQYVTGGLLTEALLKLANETGQTVLIDPSLATLPRSTPADVEKILARVRKDMGLE